MSFTVTFGWWLAPAVGTLLMFIIAAIVVNRIARGDGDTAGLLMFPASCIAIVLSLAIWAVYFLYSWA